MTLWKAHDELLFKIFFNLQEEAITSYSHLTKATLPKRKGMIPKNMNNRQ